MLPVHQQLVDFIAGLLMQGGSVAEWLACLTQAQKDLGSNHSRETVHELFTDVDPPRFLPSSNSYRRGHIVSPPQGRYLVRQVVAAMRAFVVSTAATC